MAQSIKLKDNTYWDSTAVTHNQELLKDFLDKELYYRAGDTIEGWWKCPVATNGSNNFSFQIPLWKPMGSDVTEPLVTIQTLYIYYGSSRYTVTPDSLSISVTLDNRVVEIKATSSSMPSGYAKYIPANADVQLTITFI